MIYQLTSINVVIAKIIRDLGLNQSNEEIPVNDFIEWCAEALLHVGAYAQFQEKIVEINISDYKSKLPCDFYKMIDICGGGYYDNYFTKEIISEECTKSNYITYNGDARGFNINFDNITTSYQSGTMIIKYQAMPVDEEGAPMVPDNQSFRDLLFWKCVYQLAIQGRKFASPQMNDINFSRQKLNFYTLQSRAEANMPDITTQKQVSAWFKSWSSNYKNVNTNNFYFKHF